MSELKLVTRNIRINGIQHKASDMSEEEIKCLLIQRQDKLFLNMNYERKAADGLISTIKATKSEAKRS